MVVACLATFIRAGYAFPLGILGVALTAAAGAGLAFNGFPKEDAGPRYRSSLIWLASVLGFGGVAILSTTSWMGANDPCGITLPVAHGLGDKATMVSLGALLFIACTAFTLRRRVSTLINDQARPHHSGAAWLGALVAYTTVCLTAYASAGSSSYRLDGWMVVLGFVGDPLAIYAFFAALVLLNYTRWFAAEIRAGVRPSGPRLSPQPSSRPVP